MKLHSQTNLQITTVRQLPDGQFVFVGFTKVDNHQTNVKQSHIICGESGGYRILRTIEDEIGALEVLNQRLVAIGRFGAVYGYDFTTERWTDWTGSLESRDILSRTIVDDDQLISVGTGQQFVRFTGDGWRSVCDAMEPDDGLDFHGLYPAGMGHYWVCGEDGFLADISADAIARAELTSSPSLMDVAALPQAGTVAACGRRGALFVSRGDGWTDERVDGIKANFSRIVVWRGAFYLSGNTHIYRFSEEGLHPFGDIQSHSLCTMGDSLWSIGLNQLHRLSDDTWNEIVIEVDAPDAGGGRYRAVPKS